MSKSRRDLSLFAISALVATSFAFAAPAQAAGELKIEPHSGASFAVPHLNDISLKVSATGGNDSRELEDLHFRVTTSGTTDVLAGVADGVTTTVSRIVDSSADEDAGVVTSATEFDYSSGDRVSTITLKVENDAAAYVGTDDTVRVTVTAFIDKDNDNLPDSDEWQVAQEVSFLDYADVTYTNSMTQPVLGDSSVSTTISGANFNLDQSDLSVVFAEGSTVVKARSDSAYWTYSAVRDDLKVASHTTVPASTVTSATYSATLYATTTTSAANRLAAASSRPVSSTTVNQVSGVAVRTDKSDAVAANDSAQASKKVMSGSGSLSYVVSVATSALLPIEDKSVSLKVEETGNTSLDAATITVNGTALTNASNTAADDMTVSATTNALGKATFTIAWSGLDKTEAFKITASVDGVAEGAVTFTAEDETASAVYSADVRAKDEERVIATDAQWTATYHVLNQFGGLYTGTDATVEVSDGTSTFSSSVKSGAATISMPGYDADNDGDLDMSADVKTTGGDPGVTAWEHDVFVGSVNAPATLVIAGSYGTASAALNLNSEATARADVRFGQYTDAPDSEITDATVTVLDSNGNGTRSQVTFSGTNLIFEVDANSSNFIYEKGSITVWTDESGIADVDISSQYAGKQVLTITAGGVTKTKDIYFGSVGVDAGTTVTLTAPSSVQQGATFKVEGTLTDDYGNPVKVTDTADVKVTYDGPGIAFGTLPNTTDANRYISFAVLVGANDKGTATVTFSYDQNSDDDFTDAKDKTASTTIAVGQTAAADQKVNAGSFKGYVAVYAKGYEGQRLSAKIGNDWVIVPSLASNFERVVDFTGAGVDIAVRIYIDRVLLDTIALTTK